MWFSWLLKNWRLRKFRENGKTDRSVRISLLTKQSMIWPWKGKPVGFVIFVFHCNIGLMYLFSFILNASYHHWKIRRNKMPKLSNFIPSCVASRRCYPKMWLDLLNFDLWQTFLKISFYGLQLVTFVSAFWKITMN